MKVNSSKKSGQQVNKSADGDDYPNIIQDTRQQNSRLTGGPRIKSS
jgi:hypothetical protein